MKSLLDTTIIFSLIVFDDVFFVLQLLFIPFLLFIPVIVPDQVGNSPECQGPTEEGDENERRGRH